MSRNVSPTRTSYRQPQRNPAEDAPRLRMALDAALEEWWQQGRLPDSALLRDSLFLLQAGHTLDDAQLSLLLRAALANHLGMVTALRHQVDAERTAVILADALLAAPPAGLTVAELQQLRQADEGSAGWVDALPAVLYEETSSADSNRRRRALTVIDALGAGPPLSAPLAAYELVDEKWPLVAGDALAEQPATERGGVTVLKVALLLVLAAVLALAGLWLWQRAQLEGMVQIPAGSYAVTEVAGGGQEPVEISAFAIDRHEVTIGDYRQCIDRGRCPQPSSSAGETRPTYLLDGAFDRFPVVNVNWHAANAYCTWRGKRLPTAPEWEIAAGYAPGAKESSLYPWGEMFQLQRANSERTGLGDVQQVGSYHPSGDSAFGVSDMSGNVAEWTATNVGREADGDQDRFLVKGGSFRDGPEALLISSAAPFEASFASTWLGFRCAIDMGGRE